MFDSHGSKSVDSPRTFIQIGLVSGALMITPNAKIEDIPGAFHGWYARRRSLYDLGRWVTFSIPSNRWRDNSWCFSDWEFLGPAVYLGGEGYDGRGKEARFLVYENENKEPTSSSCWEEWLNWSSKLPWRRTNDDWWFGFRTRMASELIGRSTSVPAITVWHSDV
jgi:hypothetical protein